MNKLQPRADDPSRRRRLYRFGRATTPRPATVSIVERG